MWNASNAAEPPWRHLFVNTSNNSLLLVAAQSYFELATRTPDALTRSSVGSNISSEELTISSLKPKLVGRYGGFGIEYLLGRTKKTERRAAFERCPLEHVLSYQRRISLIKHNFLMRGSTTPLGKILDFCDRTEAQQRGKTVLFASAIDVWQIYLDAK